GQYNVNLARQVAIGSQLRLWFEQEAKLLRKSVAQVSGKEKLKAAFEEFKRYEDDRVERRCAELDARLDALSIDFDEELYPHMLTAIAGYRQAFVDVVSAGITNGMSEGLRHGVDHGQAQLNVESIEAYDPEAEAKFVAALQALKDLTYPLLDQLEGLKDAPIDVIMASLYLKSDTGEDAPQYIRDLRPSSSQLTIPVYPEAEASDQGTAAPEMPSFKDVPATVAPGAGQAEETATTDPLAALKSRKRGRDGTDVNAPPNDLDPLSFADAPLRHPVYVAQSSPVRYVGISISACITASVSYVRENGVSLWLDLIIVRWAQRM
nr:hypothetical protein [Tanacetum cinerariifolium]